MGIHGIVNGYPWNCQWVSMELSMGIHGIVNGYLAELRKMITMELPYYYS